MGMPFVHLHTHSEYSLLDSLARINDLVEHAHADNQPALAVTDHGTLAGIYTFFSAVRAHNKRNPDTPLKPIAGNEVYLAIGPATEHNKETRHGASVDADSETDGTTYDAYYDHLTVIARTNTGWRNLLRLHNLAYEDGRYFKKPRIDYDLLKRHGDGLIVLTGCIGGPVAGPLSRGDIDTARTNLRTLIDCVGHENVYVEIMDHNHPLEGEDHLQQLIDLADEHGLTVVTTNDCHMVENSPHAHEAFLAVGTKRTIETNTFVFEGDGYHLRTGEEMRDRATFTDPELNQRWLQACDATVHLAERVDDDVLDPDTLRLPAFDVPEEYADSYDMLATLVATAAKKAYNGTPPVPVQERLQYEIDVIADLNLCDYFLISWDMINYCRQNGIATGVGRGSAAGSLLSYYLGLVGVDALKYDLLFERFLEPGREGMPDIDFDIESSKRHLVIDYLRTKYGEDHVAQIGAFQNIKSKQAIKDAVRVMGGTATLGDKLAKLVPMKGVIPVSLDQAFDPDNPASHDLLEELDTVNIPSPAGDYTGEHVKQLARRFENVTRGESVHASGILISDEPLPALVPLRLDKDDPVGDGIRVCRWDMKDVDTFGLLKLDLLGLRNLDVIATTQRFIHERTGETVDYLNLGDPDDLTDERTRKAWDILAQGKTPGLFQLESSGMTQLLTEVAPHNLQELSDVIALYRPGPMSAGMPALYTSRKHGHTQINYDTYTTDPDEQHLIGTVLNKTNGCMVYQEQLMRLGDVVAGFTPTWRSKLRKAVSKKNKQLMDEVGEKFLHDATRDVERADGTVSPAFAHSTATRLWEDFKGNAEYLFNASHSLAYAQLAYITAYLKANWPVEYAAAVLAMTDRGPKRETALASLQSEGIRVASPDINVSGAITSPVGDHVSIGLAEIKGMPTDMAHGIVTAREKDGRFTCLADVVKRVETNARGVSVLIESGACDAFGPRKGLLRVARATRRVPVPKDEWNPFERAARQHETLGLTLDDDPLDDVFVRERIREFRIHKRDEKPLASLESLAQCSNRQWVRVYAILETFATRTYSGGTMANIELASRSTRVRGVMWNDDLAVLRAERGEPQCGYPVAVVGQVSLRTVTFTDAETGEETESEPRVELKVTDLIPITDAVPDDVEDADFYNTTVVDEPVENTGVGDEPAPPVAPEPHNTHTTIEPTATPAPALVETVTNVVPLGEHATGHPNPITVDMEPFTFVRPLARAIRAIDTTIHGTKASDIPNLIPTGFGRHIVREWQDHDRALRTFIGSHPVIVIELSRNRLKTFLAQNSEHQHDTIATILASLTWEDTCTAWDGYNEWTVTYIPTLALNTALSQQKRA